METILNKLQERLNGHNNLITGNGVRMVDFAYVYYVYLKDDVLKEMPRRGFGLFVHAWSLIEFFNMEYTSESSSLERGKKIRGAKLKSSGEDHVGNNFDQHYPAFLVVHPT